MTFHNFCFTKGKSRDEIRENIVSQNNLYIQQKQKGKSILPVEESELYAMALLESIYLWDTISYHQWLGYWKSDPDLSVPFVFSGLSRLRFDQILWNLHVSGNSVIPAENKDKLYKLRPLITSLKEDFVKLMMHHNALVWMKVWYYSRDEAP